MINRIKRLGVMGLILGGISGPLAAGPQLTFKTGFSNSNDAYPYAYDNLVSADPIVPISAPFGQGPYAGAKIAFSNVVGSYGIELETNLVSLRDTDAYGFAQEGGNCSEFAVRDLISLVHSNCMSGADTKSVTAYLNSRAMVSRYVEDWDVTALVGVGTLAFASETTGRMYYASENSAQLRQNTFDGTGLSIGLRHQRSIGTENTLKVEGIAGLYRGPSKIRVEGVYLSAFDAYEDTQDVWVRSLDLSVSLARQVNILGFQTEMEIGAVFGHVDGALDTANYNSFSGPIGPDSVAGSQSTGISSMSLFFGTSINL